MKNSVFFSVFRSVASDRQLINLQHGIPRVIFLTDLSGVAPLIGSDTASARSWGFAKAKEIGLRLQRAEVYLVGTSSGRMRDAMEAFFLASEGDLVAWPEEMLGAFGPNPVSVQVFRGQVSYCENEFPMELRLSLDAEGQLTNSWLAVTIQERTSTPVRGSFVCEATQKCSLTSRDNGLGQLWSTSGPEAGNKLELSPALPLSGFRRLDAKLEGEELVGRIWDPAARLDCKENKTETAYRFRLTKSEGIPF
ncbi:MAG: hypothetical protein KatS3mg015_2611 [Fimbriimonadales bacterium]|nr:MAG: hypothetical protein KatS3mg015_2611 [Fimbriimonadales bacterium]